MLSLIYIVKSPITYHDTNSNYSVITEEQAQERSDRAALIPWVKFLWESYTQCLDLLRNNARLETLYHDIAQMVRKILNITKQL